MLRDKLIRIALMCGEFEASALILDNKDIKKVFSRYNNTIAECFEERYAA